MTNILGSNCMVTRVNGNHNRGNGRNGRWGTSGGYRMVITVLLFLCFWALQAGANVFFKMGSGTPQRWWLGFVAGNLLGMSSIYLLMRLYARMDVHVALAIAGGGAFLAVQAALALAFGGRPTALQWAGFLLVAAGMVLATLAAQQPAAQGPVARAIAPEGPMKDGGDRP
jgi:drug/metabolite transporter (DMT)-like permease